MADYRVSLESRLRDLFLLDRDLGPGMSLTYTWTGGGERYEVKREGGGGETYQGVYHPNEGVCEPTAFAKDAASGPFVCNWCGSVCW